MTEEIAPAWDHPAVIGMINTGDHAGAAGQIDAFLVRDPGSVAARVAKARLQLATGDTEDAIGTVTQLLRDAPANVWVWALGVEVLSRSDRVADIKALFLDGQTRLSPEDNVLTPALNTILPVIGSMPEQLAFLKEAISRQPKSRVLQLRLATRAHHVGDFDLALRMLEEAKSQGSLPPFARTLQSQLYPMQGSMADAADRIAQDVANGDETVETLCRLCRYSAAAGRFKQSQAALVRVLDLFPMEWRTLYRLNRQFLSATDDAVLARQLAVHLGREQADRNWLLQFALFSLRAGEKDTARHVLESLAGDPVVGPTARSVLNALAALDTLPDRPRVLENKDVCVIKHASAKGTIFVFGSFLGGINYIPHHQIDAMFAGLPANVVYLRDPYGRGYLNGIPELGPNEEAMQIAMRRLAADLGRGAIVTIGSSIAGYAALRSGLAIGATSVISLAGVLKPDGIRTDDPKHIQQGMSEIFRTAKEPSDLGPSLAAQPSTKLTLMIGGSYAPDLQRSQSAAGIKNAIVIALPGVDSHHVGMPAIANGMLRGLLVDALDAI